MQLSVNLVALVSAAVGAIAGGVPPLNVLQLLWVNMIMDTLAALALATEDPVSGGSWVEAGWRLGWLVALAHKPWDEPTPCLCSPRMLHPGQLGGLQRSLLPCTRILSPLLHSSVTRLHTHSTPSCWTSRSPSFTSHLRALSHSSPAHPSHVRPPQYPELLEDPPHGRYEPLITGWMWMHILVSAAYKLLWLFLCLYALPRVGIPRYEVISQTDYFRQSCVKELVEKVGGWGYEGLQS